MAVSMIECYPLNTPSQESRREECKYIPNGFEKRDWQVYESDAWIVVIGEIDEDDETHNCDEMGCGWEHVLYRFKKSGPHAA